MSLIPEEIQIWERLDGETNKAWSAFKLYRDMPTHKRTELAAYIAYRKLNDPSYDQSPRTASGKVPSWKKRHDWAARALAFDRRQDAETIRQASESAEHIAKLESYRDRLLAYSKLSTDSAIRCMSIIQNSLTAMEKSKDEGGDGGIVSPALLPKYIIAVTKMFEAAANAESESLAVERILEFVGDGSKRLH